jgi:hypothetical protein
MKKLLLGIVVGMLISVPASVFATSQWHDKTMNADYDNLGTITRYDDNHYQVKCWVPNDDRAGLSCLPWSQIKER